MVPVSFLDGAPGNVVLAGGRSNPKGAIVVLSGDSAGEVKTLPFADGLNLLSSEAIVDVLCMQERAFGDSGLAPPPETAGEP